MDIAYSIRRAVREHRKSRAVVCDDTEYTYGDLDRRAARLANALTGLGLEPGDRVAILASNDPLYPVTDVALAYGGFVRVALNARLGLSEFSYIIEDCGARALVTDAEFDDIAAELSARHELTWIRSGTDRPTRTTLLLDELIDGARDGYPETAVGAEAPAWISYTSGTTGKPKGVVLSRRALLQVAHNMMVELGPIVPGSSILLPQPLSHGAGFFVWPYLSVGGTVHIMRRWDAEQALAIGEREGVETLKIVPAMLPGLVDSPGPLPFSSIIYGAAPMPVPWIETALDRFGPVLMQIYGQTEAPATITVLHKRDHVEDGPQRGSAGRPWRTVSVDIRGEDGRVVGPGELGELTVEGPHVMTRYHGLPEATGAVLRDGRVWTRDLAVTDERGFVYLRGRMDDMINSGGFNIAPKEVEEVVETHSAVDECVALGVPDERFGETVRVYVTLANGGAATADDLMEYCRPRLGIRRPRSVVFLAAMPRNPYGKVDRAALRAGDPDLSGEQP